MDQIISEREVTRLKSMLHERMDTAFQTRGIVTRVYGSQRDGTMLQDGDVDIFEYFVWMTEDFQKEHITYLQESPGFLVIKRGPNKGLVSTKDFKKHEQFYEKEWSKTAKPNELNENSAAVTYTFPTNAYNINESLDKVPCFACCGWPEQAKLWACRHRNWPNNKLVKDILESGFHIVPKPSYKGDPGTEWRLSFSFAEARLMDTITGPRLTVYCILKRFLKENLHTAQFLSTYHLKTLFFWACEKKPESAWQKVDICFFGLLDLLIHGLAPGIIKHYFLPKVNLLSNIPPEILSSVAYQLLSLKAGLKMEIQQVFVNQHDLARIGVMELALWSKEFELYQNQLNKRDPDARTDMYIALQSMLRRLSAFLSNYASLCCYAEKESILNSTQVWITEDTLSCTYAMLWALDDNIKQWVKSYTDLLSVVEGGGKAMPERGAEAKTKQENLELPHGRYRSVVTDYFENIKANNSISILQHKVLDSLARKASEQQEALSILNLVLKTLLDAIFVTEITKEQWNVKDLTEPFHHVLPNFSWSGEHRISIHTLAKEKIWAFKVPFDEVLRENVGRNCDGKCFETTVVRAAKLVLGTSPETALNACGLYIDNSFHVDQLHVEGQNMSDSMREMPNFQAQILKHRILKYKIPFDSVE